MKIDVHRDVRLALEVDYTYNKGYKETMEEPAQAPHVTLNDVKLGDVSVLEYLDEDVLEELEEICMYDHESY